MPAEIGGLFPGGDGHISRKGGVNEQPVPGAVPKHICKILISVRSQDKILLLQNGIIIRCGHHVPEGRRTPVFAMLILEIRGKQFTIARENKTFPPSGINLDCSLKLHQVLKYAILWGVYNDTSFCSCRQFHKNNFK